MILLRSNCKLWTVLVTQFMYSLGLSLCSFSKLGYINTYSTSPQWLKCLNYDNFFSDLWGAWFNTVQFNTVLFFFSLQPHLFSSTVIHTVTYKKRFVKKAFTWMYFRNIPKVFPIFPWKKIKVQNYTWLWHLSYQVENSFSLKFVTKGWEVS